MYYCFISNSWRLLGFQMKLNCNTTLHWPCGSFTVPTFPFGMRQTDIVKLNLFLCGVTWYQVTSLLNHLWQKDYRPTAYFSSCWYTPFFFPLMSNCKLSHGGMNRQVLPLPHSLAFYSHIKCPEEHASHGFIPLSVQPKSQSNWNQLSTQRRNISSFMES